MDAGPDIDLVQSDAGPDVEDLPLPTLQGTFIAAGAYFSSPPVYYVVRVTMPSGTITPLWQRKLPTGWRLGGIAKRPDGALDILEAEPRGNMLPPRTHVQAFDKMSGAPIGSERTFDGIGEGAEYAPDGTMYVAWHWFRTSEIATFDPQKGLVKFLDVVNDGNAADVAFVGKSMFTVGEVSGEDLFMSTLRRSDPSQSDWAIDFSSFWRITPLAGQIITVGVNGDIIVIDPATKARSGLSTNFYFSDATED